MYPCIGPYVYEIDVLNKNICVILEHSVLLYHLTTHHPSANIINQSNKHSRAFITTHDAGSSCSDILHRVVAVVASSNTDGELAWPY
jgi:hypothetical protein